MPDDMRRVNDVSTAKTAESTKVRLGCELVGTKKPSAIDGSTDPPRGWGNFVGGDAVWCYYCRRCRLLVIRTRITK